MLSRFYILQATKDTAINSYFTNANLGKSFILPLMQNESISGHSRILLDFNISEITNNFDLASLTSNSFTATLKMYEIIGQDVPTYHNQNWNINLFTLTANWDEGLNYQYDFSETGYANYLNSYNGTLWVTSGGDYNVSLSGNMALTSGYEDISIDVTQYVKNYIYLSSGISSNISGISSVSAMNGFLLKFDNITEGLTSFIESKNFYSRHTHTIFAPQIYFQIDIPQYYDNRNNFILGKQQSLYFPYKIDGALQNSITSATVTILQDGITLTSITSGISYISPGIFNVSFSLPSSGVVVGVSSSTSIMIYSASSIYNDVWQLINGNSITGQFKVYQESDYIGLDYSSLTGNFNKNYVSHSLMDKIGIAIQYEKEMYSNNTYFIKFNPFMKRGNGVDNLNLLFNNDLIYPQQFYVKFMDVYTQNDLTGWILLDLIGDSYQLELFTNSFRIGQTITFIFQMQYLNNWKIIRANSYDMFKII